MKLSLETDLPNPGLFLVISSFFQVDFHLCAKFCQMKSRMGKVWILREGQRLVLDLGLLFWHKTEARAVSSTGWQMLRHFPHWTLITTNNKHSRSCLESFWWILSSSKGIKFNRAPTSEWLWTFRLFFTQPPIKNFRTFVIFAHLTHTFLPRSRSSLKLCKKTL